MFEYYFRHSTPKAQVTEVTLRHIINNRPVKRLTLVARLPPAFYIGPHAG